MLAVIDESGDPGFSIGSSPYFVMGMVYFQTHEAAEHASRAVDLVRRTMNIRGEFKFTSTSDRVKEAFFSSIADCDLQVRYVVVDKRVVRRREVKESPASFYLLCLRGLMGDSGSFAHGTVVKLDKCGSKEFRNTCAAYARQDLPPGSIKQFKLVDSATDNLIQLADMIVGAIARPYNSPKKINAHRWHDLIEDFNASIGEIIIR